MKTPFKPPCATLLPLPLPQPPPSAPPRSYAAPVCSPPSSLQFHGLLHPRRPRGGRYSKKRGWKAPELLKRRAGSCENWPRAGGLRLPGAAPAGPAEPPPCSAAPGRRGAISARARHGACNQVRRTCKSQAHKTLATRFETTATRREGRAQGLKPGCAFQGGPAPRGPGGF